MRPFSVLYYGNYIPLHGLEFVAEAIAGGPPLANVDFTFIGEGELRQDFEARLSSESNVTFRNYMPPDALAQAIAGCDVVLGIFGTSGKAKSVIANKGKAWPRANTLSQSARRPSTNSCQSSATSW